MAGGAARQEHDATDNCHCHIQNYMCDYLLAVHSSENYCYSKQAGVFTAKHMVKWVANPHRHYNRNEMAWMLIEVQGNYTINAYKN